MPSLLIVDDEKTQREGLRAVLEDAYDVYLAEDAESAIGLLEAEPFDVLLTDYKMPKEDGLALIVRAKSLAKRLRVVSQVRSDNQQQNPL